MMKLILVLFTGVACVVYPQFLLVIGVVIGSLATIFMGNPVFAIIGLIITFIFSAMLMITQNAEFLGLVYLVVYIGAIAVLFLFVSMMLESDIKLRHNLERSDTIQSANSLYELKIALFSIFCCYFTVQNVLKTLFIIDINDVINLLPVNIENLYTKYEDQLIIHSIDSVFWEITTLNVLNELHIVILGKILYLDYALIFLLTGILLTVAMILSVILSVDNSLSLSTRHQAINKQLTATMYGSLRRTT